ncbi:amino acid racemase [archaeon]|nr:MAG: amino acid racemase [archaeon]
MVIFGEQENAGIGIVGGLGPETSAKFSLDITNRIRKLTGANPNLIIDNVPMPEELEEDAILGDPSEKVFHLIKQSVLRLNKIGVRFIVLPCNTVHIFFDRLQKISKAPIINIIDETVSAAKRSGFQNIGLLATTGTINSRLYQKAFEGHNIRLILPNNTMQRKVSDIILITLKNSIIKKDTDDFHSILDKLFRDGAEAVILGCTDLQLLISQNNKIKLIDSMKVLEDRTIDFVKGVKDD